MATDFLVLGGIVFDDWSTPERMPFGGPRSSWRCIVSPVGLVWSTRLGLTRRISGLPASCITITPMACRTL